MYMIYFVSSPYLLVFGDDRVRGTREHMMLQVDLVRLNIRAGELMGKQFYEVFIIYGFE